MVVHTRYRRILLPVLFYALSGAATAYFAYHAYNGQRGMTAKIEYKQRMLDAAVSRVDDHARISPRRV